MAEGVQGLFNEKAKERLRSANDLDSYLRVMQPNVWVVLAACALLVAGAVAWGLFGTVNLNVNGTGVLVDGQARCFLSADAKSHVEVGNAARVGTVEMSVASIASVPLSPDEVKQLVGSDYLATTLAGGEGWVYEVDFEGDTGNELSPNVPLAVSITANELTPFQMVFGRRA